MTDHAGSFNGLAFGVGTAYGVKRLRVYRRAVAMLTPDLPRYHGGLIGVSYETPRTVEVDFIVRASSQDDLVSKLDALFAAFEPMVDIEGAFTFGLPGQADRIIFCRPEEGEGEIEPQDWASFSRLVPFRLVASDPAIYDAALITSQLTPFIAAGGFSWPAVWPISWGAGGSGGGATIEMGGTWETWPSFTINGSSTGILTNPIIEYVTGGVRLALNTNGGVSLLPGQKLVVETHPARRSVAFDTGASRYGKLSPDSVFFPFQPGSNELRFRASGSTTGATVDVAVRAARI